MTLHGTYENGVVRLDQPVDLPEHSRVEVEVRLATNELPPISQKDLDELYQILGQSFYDPNLPLDLAARHNEHQP